PPWSPTCSSSGGRPQQHSFPTRRSSDLLFRRRVGQVGRAGAWPRRIDEGERAVELHFLYQRHRVFELLIGFPGEPDDDVRGEGQDRKSTRLNSSHVKISYAVFCLKKDSP